ncbi:MAG: methyltransferase domain-containing protein [Bacteroidetes bacterium]|nr:methyltransferase domain-containing protein [Bacteroidota bacterium]
MIKKVIKKILGISEVSINKVGTYNESTRIAWLENTLKKIPQGLRILDAGAGEQQFKKLCTHLNYVSQDFAQYKPEELPEGLQMDKWDYGALDIVSDIASIPEADSSFDAIMCTEVFEHIINPIDAVREFSRLLKKNGYIIITAPFCSLTHFAPYHFYSGFNKYFYENALKLNDFEIIEATPNGNYFEYIAQEIRRLPSIAEKYSLKRLSGSEKKTLNNILKMLDNFSRNDQISSELLCFGYHILAKKK